MLKKGYSLTETLVSLVIVGTVLAGALPVISMKMKLNEEEINGQKRAVTWKRTKEDTGIYYNEGFVGINIDKDFIRENQLASGKPKYRLTLGTPENNSTLFIMQPGDVGTKALPDDNAVKMVIGTLENPSPADIDVAPPTGLQYSNNDLAAANDPNIFDPDYTSIEGSDADEAVEKMKESGIPYTEELSDIYRYRIKTRTNEDELPAEWTDWSSWRNRSGDSCTSTYSNSQKYQCESYYVYSSPKIKANIILGGKPNSNTIEYSSFASIIGGQDNRINLTKFSVLYNAIGSYLENCAQCVIVNDNTSITEYENSYMSGAKNSVIVSSKDSSIKGDVKNAVIVEGIEASVSNNNSVIINNLAPSEIQGENSVIINGSTTEPISGNNNFVTGNNNLGSGASGNILIGSSNQASGDDNVLIGNNNNSSTSEGNIFLGDNNFISGADGSSIKIGSGLTSDEHAVEIGFEKQRYWRFLTTINSSENHTKDNMYPIGDNSKVIKESPYIYEDPFTGDEVKIDLYIKTDDEVAAGGVTPTIDKRIYYNSSFERDKTGNYYGLDCNLADDAHDEANDDCDSTPDGIAYDFMYVRSGNGSYRQGTGSGHLPSVRFGGGITWYRPSSNGSYNKAGLSYYDSSLYRNYTNCKPDIYVSYDYKGCDITDPDHEILSSSAEIALYAPFDYKCKIDDPSTPSGHKEKTRTWTSSMDCDGKSLSTNSSYYVIDHNNNVGPVSKVDKDGNYLVQIDDFFNITTQDGKLYSDNYTVEIYEGSAEWNRKQAIINKLPNGNDISARRMGTSKPTYIRKHTRYHADEGYNRYRYGSALSKIWADGSGLHYTTPSDKNLKTVHGKYNKGLEEVLNLKPVNFKFKENTPYKNLRTDKTYLGFIAQEIQEIYPDTIKKDKKGYLKIEMSSLYKKIVLSLVNTAKELNDRCEKVQAKNDKIKEDIKLIENRIKELEK